MRKIKLKWLVIPLILAIIMFLAYSLDSALEDYGETALKNEIYRRVNDEIRLYINDNGAIFKNLLCHEYAADGTITAISMDTAAMARIQSSLEGQILKSLSKIESEGFDVPLGSLTGNRFFAGRGPKLQIETVPLSTMKCDTVNEFKSVGINHTLHRVGLVFTVHFRASAPFSKTEFESKFAVTLCESVIIGKVPQVYLN